jgi:Ca2+-binding RTX toxin-like protein
MGFGVLNETSNITVSTGDAVDMNGNVEIYVTTGVRLTSLDTDTGAAIGGLDESLCFVDGALFGSFGMKGQFGGNAIMLSSTSSIAASDLGIYITGGSNQITNAGYVYGDVIGIDCDSGNVTGGNSLINTGTVQCNAYNDFGVNMTGGHNSINNSGLIAGNLAIQLASGSGDALNTIVNSGQIVGSNPWAAYAIATGDAATQISNTGSITGKVAFGNGNDTITNKGTIDGDITFGSGSDVYDGTLGSISGTVHSGTGQGLFYGGAGTDSFDMSAGGTYVIKGNGGQDTFTLGANLFSGDKIDGGDGEDTVVLSGDYSAGIAFSYSTMVNVENIVLGGGHSYNLSPANATVAAGQTLTIDGSQLFPTDVMTVHADHETDGYFNLLGGAGADTFIFRAAYFSNNDIIDGGQGTDALTFTTAGTFAASDFDNVGRIETINLANGTNNLTLPDSLASTAANGTLTVHGGTGNDTIDGSAVLTSFDSLIFVPGSGNDTLKGGAGDDIFNFGASLTAADRVNGGAGSDTVSLNGDYSGGLTLVAATITNVETLSFAAGHSYSISTDDATVAAGKTLTVKANALSASDTLSFDGSAETNGSFIFKGGLGGDTFTGGAAADTFVYGSAAPSTSIHYDTIDAFNFSSDRFDTPGGAGTVTGIDTALNTGGLSTASFDGDLATALSGHLSAHHAMLFTASAGTLSGETFLVVDLNGTAGYQSGGDLVVHLAGATGALATSDFI